MTTVMNKLIPSRRSAHSTYPCCTRTSLSGSLSHCLLPLLLLLLISSLFLRRRTWSSARRLSLRPMGACMGIRHIRKISSNRHIPSDSQLHSVLKAKLGDLRSTSSFRESSRTLVQCVVHDRVTVESSSDESFQVVHTLLYCTTGTATGSAMGVGARPVPVSAVLCLWLVVKWVGVVKVSTTGGIIIGGISITSVVTGEVCE